MELKELQQQVNDWILNIGQGYYSELTNLGILMEEVGELSRVMVRKFGDQSSKKSDLDFALEDEMADVLWVLVCLANQTGIDIEQAIAKNMEKKTNRDRERHAQNDKLKNK